MTSDQHLDLGNAARAHRSTSWQTVRGTLHSAILRGELLGGALLEPAEIACVLDVSQTPVREAIKDLARGGLVVLDRNHRATVCRPSLSEIGEIVSIRRRIEGIAIERSMAQMSSQQLETARAFADYLAEEDEIGAWAETNSEFHSVFHRAISTHLSRLLVSLEEAVAVFIAQNGSLSTETKRRAVIDHYALIEAYEHNDIDRAVQVQYGHVSLQLFVRGEY